MRRYERQYPGELLHLDVKKHGRVQGIGHRITGSRTTRWRNRGIGWDFVHVAIDDASRVALASIAANERADAASTFLKATVEHFRKHGIRVERVMTDNGSAYVPNAFRDACQQLRIRHLRTKPFTSRNQREGRALHPNLPQGMGLCRGLHELL